MLTLQHKIRIQLQHPKSDFLLKGVISIQLQKDIHILADRAIITLVSAYKNTTRGLKDNLPVGTPIEIGLGYDNHLQKEFNGFVVRTESKDDTHVLHCMDHMYFYLKDISAKTYEKESLPHTLPQILTELAQDVGLSSVEVSKTMQVFGYDTFHRPAGPAINTLKRLKKELSILIYMRGKKLFATQAHQPDLHTHTKQITYHMSKNVLKSHLIYRTTKDQAINIHIKSKTKEDQPLEVIASGDPERPTFVVNTGYTGYMSAQSITSVPLASKQESITLLRYQIQDPSALKSIAQQELSRWKYDGYEGHLETWLIPFCSYGYYAKIEDEQFPERRGTFFVEKVEVFFSENGGTRKIYLSKKKPKITKSLAT